MFYCILRQSIFFFNSKNTYKTDLQKELIHCQNSGFKHKSFDYKRVLEVIDVFTLPLRNLRAQLTFLNLLFYEIPSRAKHFHSSFPPSTIFSTAKL